MPQVNSYCELVGDNEFLAVAEDSVWPSSECTPSNVSRWHEANAAADESCNALWLGACRGSIYYNILLGVHFRCFAPAGCKLISGDKRFWNIVSDAFDKLSKDFTSDCVFQLLSGAGLLKVPKQFPAATLTHYSARVLAVAPQSDFECKGRFRPLRVLGIMQ